MSAERGFQTADKSPRPQNLTETPTENITIEVKSPVTYNIFLRETHEKLKEHCNAPEFIDFKSTVSTIVDLDSVNSQDAPTSYAEIKDKIVAYFLELCAESELTKSSKKEKVSKIKIPECFLKEQNTEVCSNIMQTPESENILNNVQTQESENSILTVESVPEKMKSRRIKILMAKICSSKKISCKNEVTKVKTKPIQLSETKSMPFSPERKCSSERISEKLAAPSDNPKSNQSFELQKLKGPSESSASDIVKHNISSHPTKKDQPNSFTPEKRQSASLISGSSLSSTSSNRENITVSDNIDISKTIQDQEIKSKRFKGSEHHTKDEASQDHNPVIDNSKQLLGTKSPKTAIILQKQAQDNYMERFIFYETDENGVRTAINNMDPDTNKIKDKQQHVKSRNGHKMVNPNLYVFDQESVNTTTAISDSNLNEQPTLQPPKDNHQLIQKTVECGKACEDAKPSVMSERNPKDKTRKSPKIENTETKDPVVYKLDEEGVKRLIAKQFKNYRPADETDKVKKSSDVNSCGTKRGINDVSEKHENVGYSRKKLRSNDSDDSGP